MLQKKLIYDHTVVNAFVYDTIALVVIACQKMQYYKIYTFDTMAW